MLFGNINQLDLLPYADSKLGNWINEAITIAKDNPEGKYPLGDARVFVIIAAAQTEPAIHRAAEIHKQYIDVQILLEGEERLGYSNRLEESIRALDSLENDLLFIDKVDNENFVDLQPGDFALFFPNQIHRPLCAIKESMPIKKAIIKIPHGLFL